MSLRKGENAFRQYDAAYLSAVYQQNIEIVKKVYGENEKVSPFDGFEEGVKRIFGRNSTSSTAVKESAASYGCE